MDGESFEGGFRGVHFGEVFELIGELAFGIAATNLLKSCQEGVKIKRFVTITGGGSGRVLTEGMWGGRRVVQRQAIDAAWGLEWGEGRLFGNASGTGRSSCRYD